MQIRSVFSGLSEKWRSLPYFARVIALVLMDAALIGIGLCVFALFHHVIATKGQSLGITSSRDGTISTRAETTAPDDSSDIDDDKSADGELLEPTVEPTAELVQENRIGDFSVKFANKFTTGEVIDTVLEDGTRIYQSANLNLAENSYQTATSTYHIIDIYIRDISCLSTVFANDTYGKGQAENQSQMVQRTGAVAAINGDYYGARSEGSVVRNGELYREDSFGDLGVLYWDGTFETYSFHETTATTEMENGAYQVWSFGPMLIKDGESMRTFQFDTSQELLQHNPRSVFGYFEPGHYCFVAVDGRNDTSKGLDMADLSKLMVSLGCTKAYNLDGGKTSQLFFNGERINDPDGGGRYCSDMVIIRDIVE